MLNNTHVGSVGSRLFFIWWRLNRCEIWRLSVAKDFGATSQSWATWGERGSCCQWSSRHDFTSEISCIFHHAQNGSFRSHQILKVNCQRIKHVGCCIKRGTILRVKYLVYFTTHKTAPLGATKSWKSIVNVLNMLDAVSSEARFYEWNILYISPLTKRLL